MSWDISVYAADVPPPPVGEMPDDWKGQALGDRAEVRRRISACLPGVDWSDPSWGQLVSDEYVLELNMGDDDPVEGFMIHVRGGGEAVSALLKLATETGWYLLDCSEGEWFHHHPDPESSWTQFQEYRARVMKE